MAKKTETFNPDTIKIQYDQQTVGEWFYCNADAYYKGKHVRTTEGFVFSGEKSGLIRKIFGKDRPEPIDLVKITVRIEWSNKRATIIHESHYLSGYKKK